MILSHSRLLTTKVPILEADEKLLTADDMHILRPWHIHTKAAAEVASV